jgi:hypothetical protein
LLLPNHPEISQYHLICAHDDAEIGRASNCRVIAYNCRQTVAGQVGKTELSLPLTKNQQHINQ